jgi:putative ABC transport system permease protein
VRATRSRSVLIVAQLGLAVMLLVLATLLTQALVAITAVSIGVDKDRLLTARLDLPEWRYANDAAVIQYDDQLPARLKANRGIQNAAWADRLPILDGEPITEVTIDGRTTSRPEDRPWAVVTTVSESYFSTMGVGVVAGRAFGPEDQAGRPDVAVVNREMVRRFWSDPAHAIGARVSAAGRPLQIVGVVSDVVRADREAVNPQIYVSSRQRPSRAMTLIVRADDPRTAAAVVREQIRGLDVDVPVSQMRSYQEGLDDDLSSSVVLGSMFIAFAILALVLAASGLYAVVSYSASQRVKEFGVRVALGAVPGDITRMMLRQTGVLVAIGLVLGLVGGRVLAMLATTLLYKVSPSDPATYAGVAVTLGAVALLASYVPVRRATAIDPVQALRLE